MGPDDSVALFAHIRQTDPDRFWVCTAGGEPVGFGTGWVRGPLSFCGGLFVSPGWQGRGVGRRLFSLAMDGLPAAGGVAALHSNAANPVSNRLYACNGIRPLYAFLNLVGPTTLPEGDASTRRTGLDAVPLDQGHLGILREIDAAVLGTDRTLDHRWHLGVRRGTGWLFRRRGRAVGYAYLGGDGSRGQRAVGPVATLRPQDLAPVLRFALGELAALGVDRALVNVPGPAEVAQALLWPAGFAFSGATGLFCASRPFGRFDRYLPAGYGLL